LAQELDYFYASTTDFIRQHSKEESMRYTVLMPAVLSVFMVFGGAATVRPGENDTVSVEAATQSKNLDQSPATPQRSAEESAERAEKAREAAETAAEQAREAAIDKEDCRHDGGGGGIGVQMVWLSTEPFRQLAKKEHTLRDKTFDFNNNLTPMIGLTGYHESCEGFRGGMALWAGYKTFTSDVYPVDNDTATHDSVIMLRLIPVLAGFNFDKVFHFARFNMSLGGMLGGGAYIMHMRAYDRTLSDAFVNMNTSDTADSHAELGSWAWAPYAAGEVRAGAGVDLAPAFHMTVEGFVLITYAPEGFGVATGDFMTASPGVRLRLLFGRAG
jgi:hypothetical protein